MGGGGGGSSSSSSTASTTTNLDKRQVVDGSSIGVSSDSSTVNITALDHGAIDKAGAVVNAALATISANDAIQGESLGNVLSLAESNTDAVISGLGGVIGLASELFKGGFDALKTSQDQVNNAYSTATDLKQSAGSIDNKTLMILGVAAAAAFVMARN